MNYSTNPTVLDIYHVASNMRHDEIEQYLAMTGLDEYDPDVCTKAVIVGMGQYRFCLYDTDHEAYCIGGFTQVAPMVWQTWMMGTDKGWKDNWRSITKLSRRLMDTLLESNQCNRIQCYSLSTRDFTHLWYKKGLGLSFESTVKKYFADGQDADCHIKVKE